MSLVSLAMHYGLRRPMGFKMCEKLSKVDVWFSLILTPTTKKMVPLNLKWPKFCVNFFGGNFCNQELKEIMTNSQKSVKIGPDGADLFCDNSMNHEKKKSSKYRRRLRLSSWWNLTFEITNIVLQKSQHNLYGSNIWMGSIRPFFLTELIEKCSFCPLQI